MANEFDALLKRFPMVAVCWRDAHTEAGWCETEEAQAMTPSPAVTVGFLVKEADGTIKLVSTVGEENVADKMPIPGGCVARMGKLVWESEHER